MGGKRTALHARELGSMRVLDPDGREVRLGDLWRERPVALVFIRHFGWIFCREQVARLRDALDEIRGTGAELVVVGSGRPEHARDFRDAERLRFPLLVDPGLESFRAAGLRRGVLSTVGPRALGHAWRALRSGARQGVTRGDPWQLGGALVVRPSGEIAYRYASREAGDQPPVGEILAALRAD